MGYRRNQTVITLDYEEGSPFPGLSVRMKSTTMDQLFEITDLAELSAGENGKLSKEQRAAWLKLRDAFVDRLIGWNYEDEKGNPLPANMETVRGEEPGFVLRLIHDWMEGVQRNPVPLSSASGSGEPSTTPTLPDVNLPMEPLPLPENLNEPTGS